MLTFRELEKGLGHGVYKITVPMSVVLGKRKKETFYLNLNTYRNAHFFKLNDAKKLFSEEVRPMLEGIPQLECCGIFYIVFPRTNRKFDVSNVCSIVDKFFCDALTDAGILPDDNYEHLPMILYHFGEVDPTYPRVDVYIVNFEEYKHEN